ncbi:MAG: molybdenum cofactor guanylyltransferase [Bacteroidales bacterium]|nr:molybdenum cofactor guanylyltransferase [Bacteroidales bacterium]
MSNNDQITGIILCGGKSSRMGKDKGLCLLNNEPLVKYVIRILKIACDALLIGTNDNNYETFGIPVVPDHFKGIGPIGGIYSCLQASSTDRNIVLSCDMPLITVELVRFIIEQPGNPDAIVPLFEGLPEPLCALYHKRTIPKIKYSIEKGDYKIQDVLNLLNTRYVVIDSELTWSHKDLFYNINSADDLDRIEQRLRSKKKHD